MLHSRLARVAGTDRYESVKSKSALLFDFFFVLFFAYMIWEANEWDTPAKLFPWAIGIPMLVLAVIHLFAE